MWLGSKPKFLHKNSAHPKLLTGIIYLFFHMCQKYVFGLYSRDHRMLSKVSSFMSSLCYKLNSAQMIKYIYTMLAGKSLRLVEIFVSESVRLESLRV